MRNQRWLPATRKTISLACYLNRIKEVVMKSRFGICGLTVALLLGITFSFPDLGALSSQTFRQVAIASVRAPYPTGQVEQQPETSGQAGQGEEAQRKQEIAI